MKACGSVALVVLLQRGKEGFALAVSVALLPVFVPVRRATVARLPWTEKPVLT
jgi:hypothetical protein